ncbi:MAG: PilZ domain-containing protein [Thermodesulfobacteriota bacterium]
MGTQGQRLNLEIGIKVKIEFDGAEVPVSAVFVGMESSRYIILRLPPGAGLHEQLYEGHRAVVKYVNSGRIFGFQSQVLAYLYKKGLIAVFLDYPNSVETFELRKHERVDCLIPATLSTAEVRHKGFILDISTNGCRFGFSLESEVETNLPSVENQAELQMIFLGEKNTRNILCTVKSLHKSKQAVSAGLMFRDLEPPLQDQIEHYVRAAVNYMEMTES